MLGILLFSIFLSRWSVKWLRPLNSARVFVAGTGLVIIFLLLWDHLYQANFALLDGKWLRTWWDEMLFWENELPPAYPLLLALIYLWLRGIWDGSSAFSYDKAATAFTGGSISIVLFLLLINLDTQPPPPQTSALILLFFTMSLIALSLSSFKRGRAREVLMADYKLSLNRYWVSSSLIVIAILLVIALLLNLLVAPEGLQQVLGWLGQAVLELFLFLLKLISLILYPVLLLLSRILTPILSRFYATLDTETQADLEPLLPDDLEENVEPFIQQMPEEARWLLLLIAVVAVGGLFALVLRRLRDDDRGGIEETRESVFSLALLRQQLGQLLPNWLTRAVPLSFGVLSDEMETRRAIRKLYQNLLVWAQAQGQPRAKQQTPLEYGRILQQPFPPQAEAIDTMTTHYLRARYAADPPTAAQVQATEAAWQQLQPDGSEKE